MSSDHPTLAQIGEENISAREFKRFQRMMRCFPVPYHQYQAREDHD